MFTGHLSIYQQVQELCNKTAQVEHIPNHSDGGQEMEL